MGDDVSLSDLVNALASLRCTATPTHSSRKRNKPDQTRAVLKWLSTTKARSQSGTGGILFRLLFPETDIKRRYGLKEYTLTPLLSNVLGVDVKHGSHCLGHDVYNALSKHPSTSTPRDIPLRSVDTLLTELAARCIWSSEDVKKRRSRRTKEDILRDLLCGRSADCVAFLVQIILKDTTVLLYPPPSSKSLNDYNTNAYTKLTLHDAMGAWHWSMPRIYAKMADLDTAADAVDDLPADATPFECYDLMQARPGHQLEIPKCVKGLSLRHALDVNQGAQELMAETKYDGERMQIHVIDPNNIKIFSKSKRDSTNDRVLTIPIIREALGLPPKAYPRGFPADEFHHALSSSKPSSSVHSAIIEAEMVAFDRRKDRIDEFCRIRSLLQSGEGNYGTTKFGGLNPDSSIESIDEEVDYSSKRHLAIVFFDILHLNGRDMTDVPLCKRRKVLERTIRTVPQFSILSHFDRIDTRDYSTAMNSFQRIYASNIAQCEEGLVLKPTNGTYNSPRWRWIKVKRDYIPGLGDTADFVVIGARHDQQRGRELLVPPQVLTTFTIGLQAKQSDMRKLRQRSRISNGDIRDHYHGLFDVSYGLTRTELDQLNFEAKWRANGGDTSTLPYTCSFERGLARPSLLFQRPILFQLVGASFTRKPWSKWYEIRFPRITKVYNESDRPWNSGIGLRELQNLALDSVHVERQQAQDEIQRMFGGSSHTPSRHDRWLHTLRRSEQHLTWNKCRNWLDPAIPPVSEVERVGDEKEHRKADSLVAESSDEELEEERGVLSEARTEKHADEDAEADEETHTPSLSHASPYRQQSTLMRASQAFMSTPTKRSASLSQRKHNSKASQVLGKRALDDMDASTEEEDEGNEERQLRPLKQLKLSATVVSDEQTQVQTQRTDEDVVVVSTEQESSNEPTTSKVNASITAEVTRTPRTPHRKPMLHMPATPVKQQKALPPLDSCLVVTDVQSTLDSLDVEISSVSLAHGGLTRCLEYVGWKMRPLEHTQTRTAVVALTAPQLGLVAALNARKRYLDKEFTDMQLGRVVVIVKDGQSVVPLNGFKTLWDSSM